MLLIAITSVLAAVGIPMNFLVLYAATANSDKAVSAKLLIMHLAIANILQLISRIFTYIIPSVTGSCYPMTTPCKISVMFLCVSRRVSMFFTMFLGLYRLLKIQNKHLFFLKRTILHLTLAINWVCLTAVCLPYIILIPEDRPTPTNITKECICSFLDSLTEKDLTARLFDLVLGTGFLYFAIGLMCFFSIWMVLLLIKHKKTVFIDGTLSRPKTSRQDIIAIKAILALLVCYVTCATLNNSLRVVPGIAAYQWQRIMADLYGVVSPLILGLGYKHFRKAICKKSSICCQKSNTQQVVAIS